MIQVYGFQVHVHYDMYPIIVFQHRIY